MAGYLSRDEGWCAMTTAKANEVMTKIPSRANLNLKFRIKCYFDNNPTEELTHAMLREKFSISAWTAKWVLHELVAEGKLESVHVIRLRVNGIAKEIP
jgi:hypothetical protein